MAMMRAIVLDEQGVSLRQVPVPALNHPQDVRVRVCIAGLCRTDLLVAARKMPVRTPLILGHEFSGIVDAIGPGVHGLTPGDRVAVNPVFGCGQCVICDKDPLNCPDRTMLGLDKPGAFADFVVVPRDNVYIVPQHVPDCIAAYAEPVAAALAVLRAGLNPRHHGLIYGGNRFARLLEFILRDAGFDNLTIYDSHSRNGRLRENSFDFAIETQLDEQTLDELFWLLKPCGTLVMKSRLSTPVSTDFARAIRKQLTIKTVNYGSFQQAVGHLVENRLDLTELLGESYAIEDWSRAFAAENESTKIFLRLNRPQ